MSYVNKNSSEGYVAPVKDHVTSSDNALYLYQVLPKYHSILELRTWTVWWMLGWSQMLTDGHRDGRKTGSLYRAMPEAGATNDKYGCIL